MPVVKPSPAVPELDPPNENEPPALEPGPEGGLLAKGLWNEPPEVPPGLKLNSKLPEPTFVDDPPLKEGGLFAEDGAPKVLVPNPPTPTCGLPSPKRDADGPAVLLARIPFLAGGCSSCLMGLPPRTLSGMPPEGPSGVSLIVEPMTGLFVGAVPDMLSKEYLGLEGLLGEAAAPASEGAPKIGDGFKFVDGPAIPRPPAGVVVATLAPNREPSTCAPPAPERTAP